MDQNEEIFARFMNDRSFQKVVTGWLSTEAYRKLNSPGEDVNVGK
jgi:type I restriction enzyme R subunit